MSRISTPLPDEVFNQMKANFKVRNAIAHAHGSQDGHGKRLGHIALLYPHEYLVTEEQILTAKQQLEDDKQAAIARLKDSGILLMVGMGSTRATDPDGIDNHRVRGEFKAPNGRLFFIEVSLSNRVDHNGFGIMYCTHSVDRDVEKQADETRRNGGVYACQSKYYNCKGLEGQSELGKYTKSNLLSVVNSRFDCHFTGIEIDSYTLRVEDYTSVSPSKKMVKKFKPGDRVRFKQAFLSDFAEQLEGVTEEELVGTVQFYSEEGKLVVKCDWHDVVEAEEEKYFEWLS